MKEFPVRIKPEEFGKWNEEMVKKYDPDAFHHHPNPVVRFIEGRRVKVILKLLGIHDKDDRVLEVGCGAGNILEKAQPGNLFGIDISGSILVKAKSKLSEKADLSRADAQNLPFKNHVFKHVICSEVLEHLLDPLASLREIARILNQRGIAVISVPNELWINRIKRVLVNLGMFDRLFGRGGEYGKMAEKMEDEWHLHPLPIEKWLSLFTNCFRVIRVRGIPFFWLPLRYVIQLEKSDEKDHL